MTFGDAVRIPASPAPAQWIERACDGEWGTVGWLVPTHLPSIVRVDAPDAGSVDWWPAYRELFASVASVGARHTSTPGTAWFGVWEGHGFIGELAGVTRFDRDLRNYHLASGPVSAVTELREPGPRGDWLRPDLFWPDDRRWFVATDVDFWSLYVGGDADFTAELAERVPTATEVVTPQTLLVAED